jgi:toxin-antitoxin system PIN domain toxin
LIAVDTNILVYAHRVDSPFHAAAAHVLRELAEGNRVWAIPWPCVHEFLAKVTHPRIFLNPTPIEHAIGQLEEWLRSPSALTIGESEGYLDTLSNVLVDSRTVGSKIHDARIAALCLANGVDELWSADRDFSRFAGLNVTNPLTHE